MKKVNSAKMQVAMIEATTVNEIRSNPGLSNEAIEALIELSLKIQSEVKYANRLPK